MGTMLKPSYQDLTEGITCIDTQYHRPNLAACYLLSQADQAAFIDTGTYYSVPILLEVLRIKGIPPEQVRYIMPTHVHLDHAGGAGELMRQLPNAKLIIHPRGSRHMIDPRKLEAGSIAVYGEEEFRRHFGHLPPIPEHRVIIANDNFSLDFNGRPLLFIDTPGHARHHYSIYDDSSKGFFTGDSFGLSYRELDDGSDQFIFPPTTPVHFDPNAWQDTISRYLRFKPQRMYLTHFGMVTEVIKLADELKHSIDQVAKIAHNARDAQDRHHRILEGITKYLTARAQKTNPALSAKRIQEIFSLDLELNVQGLEVWLDRQSQRRD
jgi:glyoxylase-like metal-dependent hydrolase (beta-lactamase superfamily II)